MYKIVLGMSYYIHAGGLGALKALPGSVSKRVTPVAAIVLLKGRDFEFDRVPRATPDPKRCSTAGEVHIINI